MVAHSLRDVLCRHADSDLGLLKIDFKNAFNVVDRGAFMKSTFESLPALSNWTNWCYGGPSVLLYDHRYVILSTSGVQQGDPLGPLYFCFGLNPIVNEISRLRPVYQKWYMDDGGIVADVATLKQVWRILVEKGPALGLKLNAEKCEWSWLRASCSDPCPIDPRIGSVPTSEVCMLGVPLGTAEKNGDFVAKKLFSRLDKALAQLGEWEDAQAAFYLLRISYGIVRATHFMRTTAWDHWSEHGKEFDRKLRGVAERILGFPFNPPDAYVQACLTPSLGGLGLRRTEDHAQAAFAASFRESMVTAKENWIVPPEVTAHLKGAQKFASYKIDKAIHEALVDRAPTLRERQRLLRVTELHAGAFVTALPSTDDGMDTVMRPDHFRIAVAYRLGVPVVEDGVRCPLCSKPWINMAIMPPAAQGMVDSSSVTTA